jgi:16S rRNA (cytidine1402-2'-O)-methyltransferase
VLVATPIGNLGDLSPRAVEAFGSANLVCCEDTRRSGRLLQHAGVTARRFRRVDDHTEHAATAEVLDVLNSGGIVAVVTDAGTPGISDPGQRLVQAAIESGHTVTAVPGPAALVMALVVSGLPTERFVFEGFLPRSGKARTERLAEVSLERRTVVLYEAPHRVARTVTDLAAVCGGTRRVALCRELTKLHEEVRRSTLDEAAAYLAAHEPIGEYVVVLDGAPAAAPPGDDQVITLLRAALGSGMSKRDASTQVASQTGRAKREVYALALTL